MEGFYRVWRHTVTEIICKLFPTKQMLVLNIITRMVYIFVDIVFFIIIYNINNNNHLTLFLLLYCFFF